MGRLARELGTITTMSATALAEVESPPDQDGSLLRLYVPSLEPVPPLGPARCGFAGCVLRATHREFIGTIYLALLCDGHPLHDPER